MSKDLLLGFLMAIPLYGIVLFLFKDIIVKRFIRTLLEHSVQDIAAPTEIFSTPEFKNAVEKDLLTSYKLLLVIQDEIKYLKTTPNDETLGPIYDEKLKELQLTIDKTEELFDEMGNVDYKDIKQNWAKMLRSNKLF
jgi:predicted helicase